MSLAKRVETKMSNEIFKKTREQNNLIDVSWKNNQFFQD